jgi:hypothetical protein
MAETHEMKSAATSLPLKEISIEIGRQSTSTLNSEDFLTLPIKSETMTWSEKWEDSKGMALVLGAEMFGTGMAASARLLEMGDGGMTTMQVYSLLCIEIQKCSFLIEKSRLFL